MVLTSYSQVNEDWSFLKMENISKSSRIRKKSTRYADFVSSEDIAVTENRTRKAPKIAVSIKSIV